MMSFKDCEVRAYPYKHAVAREVFDPTVLSTLALSYPPEHLFARMGGDGYNKLSLSERNHPAAYHQFLAECASWGDFRSYVKSEKFIRSVLNILSIPPTGTFYSRFEFSSMPANGGYIAPHTDIPSKVATLVIPVIAGKWDESWGGGTDLLEPLVEHPIDYVTPLSDFAIRETVPYRSNQAFLFLKSANSWHSAGPFAGPVGVWRRTVTVNIERMAG